MTASAAIDLRALFAGARRSIARVETLPAYAEPTEDDSWQAWREGRPRPERSVRTDSYLRTVRDAVARGVTWERLRVIDTPPTDYQQWELLAYVEGQAVGEAVTIADRYGLDGLATDAWIVDGLVVVQEYDADGRWTGRHYGDVAEIDAALCARDLILANGEPLNTYLARTAPAPAPRRAS